MPTSAALIAIADGQHAPKNHGIHGLEDGVGCADRGWTATKYAMKRPSDPRLAELIRALPKSDLHVHLDGSLRLPTLIELAGAQSIDLPSYTEEGLLELAFKPTYNDLGEYLEGFKYTCAVLQTEEALERVAYELAEDCQNEGVCYLEVRFAPQLHVHRDLSLAQVVRAVARGLDRAEKSYNARAEVQSGEVPPFHAAIILCALRFFLPQFSQGYQAYFDSSGYSRPEEVFKRASLDLARAAAHFKNEEGLPVTGFDLAGREKGIPGRGARTGVPDRARGVPGQDRTCRRGLRTGVHIPGDRRPACRPDRSRDLAPEPGTRHRYRYHPIRRTTSIAWPSMWRTIALRSRSV